MTRSADVPSRSTGVLTFRLFSCGRTEKFQVHKFGLGMVHELCNCDLLEEVGDL
jgi:hypothetical protein